MTEMISFGAGWNSVAMTIMLVNEGWRGPIVFADTGGEHPETYCYLGYFGDWLKARGLEITRLSVSTHPQLYDDKRLGGLVDTLEAYCLTRSIIPLLAVRWCSVEFKRTPLVNWQKQHGIDITCIGIASDESRRARNDPTVRYPLIERGITRPECARIIRRKGLELPVKSGCFFCPGQRLSEWQRLWRDHPDLYERAAELERKASDQNQKWATLNPHGQSLDQMRERRWQGQAEMDLGDYMPCVCRL